MLANQAYALGQAADRRARRVVAHAVASLDPTARQLSTLRNTYPAWNIGLERDASGQVWWTARLVRECTAAMAAAGIKQSIRQPDAIALASTLAWQTVLLHNARSRAGSG
ncbi:hypothetical protein [Nonomuraea basaltis]|uniref:hypothetical protein n=1 Tax=Nonomuraea basaltis TaxID=2495887 RepID=UPI00110C7006|nr:hypothetical protein [Nonomuraea basaltis]TMR97322.1 hypothetical protein EJK15_18800 [Nonomuraea basaltis]